MADATDDPYRQGIEPNREVMVTTTNDLDGFRVERYLGIVRGIIVRSPGFGKALMGGFRSLGGGNVKEYIEVCESARHEAFTMMVEHAKALGAHAVIGMRYDATEFAAGASTEVLAYGTAVQVVRRV